MRKGNIGLSALVLAWVLTLFISGPINAHAHGDGHDHGHAHHEHQEDKVGILLVAFGSSYPQAQVAFENIEQKVTEAFPETPVHWAYTSHIVRKKLAREDKNLNSPAQALAQMQDEGFTHVAVQSLHTIPGAEFHDLHSVVNGFQSMAGGVEQVMLGFPLLAAPDDLQQVRQAMLDNIPKERSKDQAVIFMGHGTHHPSNAFYQAMAYLFQEKDSNVYVGTVEGSPSLENIMANLKEQGTKKAYLMPFMSVAGDHIRNDMAGDDPDSWKSILTEKGFEVETVLKGTAEYSNIVNIWVDHLKGVISNMQ
ncbi:MAG: sirohydrochlorin cobaltochelatase [Desulfovermiculus sp.]|nr:sirohydrochlorin cobaltochelatase [Desulfovermiculus sp.]